MKFIASVFVEVVGILYAIATAALPITISLACLKYLLS
jgi:hypothetical protein